MEEAKNEYKIDFGPYSVELKSSQVYFRKNNSLVKAVPVKSTFGLYDLKKMVQQVAKKVNMLNKLPKDVLKAGKDRDLLKGDLDEDFVRSGHMYKSLTYKVKDQQAVYDAYKKFKSGNRTIHIVATNKGDTVTFSGHPQKGMWMSPSISDQLDSAIQKTGKATLVKSDSKKLKENAEQLFRKAIREIAEPMLKGMLDEGKLKEAARLSFRDAGITNTKDLDIALKTAKEEKIWWDQKGQALIFKNINDLRKFKKAYGLDEGKLNEADYVVIDPRGNARPVGSKIQAQQYIKKMGGSRKGFYLVLKKNALKARRAIEKSGGKASSAKVQDIMWDLLYEVKESRSKNPIVPNYELQQENVITEADIKHFRKYLIDLGKHLGDRRLVQAAEKASSSKLKQMYDKDLHYKEFSDKEVTKYNIKKLHNMIKYDQRFDNRS